MASATTISRKTQPKAPPVKRIGRSLSAITAACVILAACESPPVKEATRETLVCPPVAQPVCPAPAPPTPAPPRPRGKLVAAPWSELPDWGREPLRPSLQAFVRSCTVLQKRAEWESVCAEAQRLAASDEREIALFFETRFEPYRVLNGDDTDTGLVTGYYEPLLRGSRTPSARYRWPLYGVPPDLLVIDLASLYPELANRRLRGRLEGNRVVPYLARGDIDGRTQPLKGRELVWVDDAVDAFFLHIQGSGQVQLENGERIRLGYADQNGHPFRSLGRALIDSGEIEPSRASMQGIKEWARRNPQKVREFLDANPSYVFFRELPPDLPGPLGAQGVPLTPERSIAVDPRVVPLGVPVWLATTYPDTSQPLNRLMVAQDTGGAIAGGVRADFYWGFGDAAGAQAGRMRQAGRMWILMPKGVAPPQPTP